MNGKISTLAKAYPATAQEVFESSAQMNLVKRDIKEAHNKEIVHIIEKRKKSLQQLYEANIRHQKHLKMASELQEKQRKEIEERDKRWSPRRMQTQLSLVSSPRIPMPIGDPTPWYNRENDIFSIK